MSETMTASSRTPVIAGFMKLTDCAPIVVAAKCGFAAAEGLDLVLHRETSWATIRDKISVGHIDVAHMLGPMAIAQNLGLTPLATPLCVPMALGFGSNTVTLSNDLFRTVVARSGKERMTPAQAAAAFAVTAMERKAAGRKIVLAIVHQHSAHHYELAYWMASAGAHPARDVELAALPPSLMADALANGRIDGFCSGEPWGSVAVARGVGTIITTKAQIWRSGAEKVLGIPTAWAEKNEDALLRLIRAIHAAARWCDEAANREELAAIVASPDVLDCSIDAVRPALAATGVLGEAVPDPMIFADRAATFPWVSHGLWFYTQMVRWGQATHAPGHLDVVRRTFRPDLYRRALAGRGIPVPSANAKVEGALTRPTPVATAEGRLTLGPDGFFDGRIFDPDLVEQDVTGLTP